MGEYITAGFLPESVNGIRINTDYPCGKRNFSALNGRTITYLVAHYTGNSKDTAKNNARYFRSGNRGASAHFFVDDSNIYQSVALNCRAWHCGTSGKYFHSLCRNANSIGIEMCCSGNYTISGKTKETAAQLFAYLCKLIGIGPDDIDTYVLRHWDVTRKECPKQMIGANNAEWAAFKNRIKDILRGDKTPLALIAQQVLDGKWGNGDERKRRLTAAGYNPAEVQMIVNALVNGEYRVMITASSGLNVREGPGVEYKKLDSFMHGVVVPVDEVRNGSGADAWGRVGTGWIALDYTAEV